MRKILFIKCGSFSNINASLVSHLKKKIPTHTIEEFDVYQTIVPKYLKSWRNIFYLIKEYGFDFITLKKSRYARWEWAFVTSYMFKAFQKTIQEHVKKNQYTFTFQTQSLFDGSTLGIPHFVYTDSTVLAVLNYPNVKIASVMKSKAWMKLEPKIYQNATLNFTFSSNQLKSIIEDYKISSKKVRCVFAGSNATINGDKLIEKKYNNKTILFVGVNWERKGGPILIKAFQKVLLMHPDARLTIVGCSKHLILINNKEEDLLNCEVVGRVPLEEVNKHFLNATLLCMPTRLEPFGIVFIEAMMHKLPIISTNGGALPDMVENEKNGYLHEMDDVESFANSIITLLNSEDLCRKMGEAGYKKYKENYNWENTSKLIAGYINEAL